MKKESDILKSLSPWMESALVQLDVNKQIHTCATVDGGVRTLKSLERRGLSRPLRYDEDHDTWIWEITPLGRRVAHELRLPGELADVVDRAYNKATEEISRFLNNELVPRTARRAGYLNGLLKEELQAGWPSHNRVWADAMLMMPERASHLSRATPRRTRT